jgi:hypothetical protein
MQVEFERKRARLHALGSLEALRATARRAAEKCQTEVRAVHMHMTTFVSCF